MNSEIWPILYGLWIMVTWIATKKSFNIDKTPNQRHQNSHFLFQFTGHSYKNIYSKSFTVSTPIHELQMSELSHICLN